MFGFLIKIQTNKIEIKRTYQNIYQPFLSSLSELPLDCFVPCITQHPTAHLFIQYKTNFIRVFSLKLLSKFYLQNNGELKEKFVQTLSRFKYKENIQQATANAIVYDRRGRKMHENNDEIKLKPQKTYLMRKCTNK